LKFLSQLTPQIYIALCKQHFISILRKAPVTIILFTYNLHKSTLLQACCMYMLIRQTQQPTCKLNYCKNFLSDWIKLLTAFQYCFYILNTVTLVDSILYISRTQWLADLKIDSHFEMQNFLSFDQFSSDYVDFMPSRGNWLPRMFIFLTSCCINPFLID
jgi:hypothetical protein